MEIICKLYFVFFLILFYQELKLESIFSEKGGFYAYFSFGSIQRIDRSHKMLKSRKEGIRIYRRKSLLLQLLAQGMKE